MLNTNQGSGSLLRTKRKRPHVVGHAGRPSVVPPRGFRPAPAAPNLGTPAPAAPAPAAPAAPAPRARQFVPDAAYNDQMDTLKRTSTYNETQWKNQERTVRHDFGIDDPTDPFSRMAGLKKLYLNKARGTSASLAAQGHLYSGAHERGLANVRFEREHATADLRKNYDAQLKSIADARQRGQFAAEGQKGQAFLDWLARQPDAADPLAADTPADAGSAPAAPGATKAKTQPGNSSARARAQANRAAQLARERAAANAAKKKRHHPKRGRH